MQLEQRMRCEPCSEQRGYPYKRGHLVRLRRSKVTTKDDGEPRYPGDQRDRNCLKRGCKDVLSQILFRAI